MALAQQSPLSGHVLQSAGPCPGTPSHLIQQHGSQRSHHQVYSGLIVFGSRDFPSFQLWFNWFDPDGLKFRKSIIRKVGFIVVYACNHVPKPYKTHQHTTPVPPPPRLDVQAPSPAPRNLQRQQTAPGRNLNNCSGPVGGLSPAPSNHSVSSLQLLQHPPWNQQNHSQSTPGSFGKVNQTNQNSGCGCI